MASSKIVRIRGRGIPIPGNDIDTDRVIPARYMKCVTFDNLGKHVFHDERFDALGKLKDHPFNDPRYKGAQMMVVNKNFGCGSSREHAPQALMRNGIRVIVGESFADIFSGNCTAIGMPVVIATSLDIQKMMKYISQNPSCELELDLVSMKVTSGDFGFSVKADESSRQRLMDGTWDTTDLLMEVQHRVRQTADQIPYMNWRRQNG